MLSRPPTDSTRSRMFARPLPADTAFGSNPDPSSSMTQTSDSGLSA